MGEGKQAMLGGFHLQPSEKYAFRLDNCSLLYLPVYGLFVCLQVQKLCMSSKEKKKKQPFPVKIAGPFSAFL